MSNHYARTVVLAAALFVPILAGAQTTKKVTYYYANPEGSVLATTDVNGSVIESSDFRPFGDTVLGTEWNQRTVISSRVRNRSLSWLQ